MLAPSLRRPPYTSIDAVSIRAAAIAMLAGALCAPAWLGAGRGAVAALLPEPSGDASDADASTAASGGVARLEGGAAGTDRCRDQMHNSRSTEAQTRQSYAVMLRHCVTSQSRSS